MFTTDPLYFRGRSAINLRAETIRPPHDTIRIAIFTSRFDFFGSIHLTIIKGNKSLLNVYFSIILKIFFTKL